MRTAARYLALACALGLGACSSDTGDNTYGSMWGVIKTSVRGSFGNLKVTRKQAENVPYASMGWRLAHGNQQLIVLATESHGDLMWTSAARIVLVTRDSRLIRSVGLGYDLGGVTPKNGGTLPAPAAALQAPFQTVRILDYPDIGRYGIQVACRSHSAGRQTIIILGRAVATTRVDEDCRSEQLRWNYTDSYWVDPEDGTVWRSRQHIHPRQEELETVLFRPPG